VTLQVFPEAMETKTRCGRGRRVHVHDRRVLKGSPAVSARRRRVSRRRRLRCRRSRRFTIGKKCGGGLRRCVTEREGKRARKQQRWLTDSSSRARNGRGTGRFPARNHRRLVAVFEESEEGKEREERGK
jgi:hypothetical protein